LVGILTSSSFSLSFQLLSYITNDNPTYAYLLFPMMKYTTVAVIIAFHILLACPLGELKDTECPLVDYCIYFFLLNRMFLMVLEFGLRPSHLQTKYYTI
jgi:hypothetical protein